MSKREIFKKLKSAVIGLMVASVLTACGSKETPVSRNGNEGAQEEGIVLNVAMYPYVPDLEHFQNTLEDAWSELKQKDEKLQGIGLNFEEWDCYENSEIDDSLDVVVFDSVFLTEYASNGELLEIPEETIDDYEDILSFVRDGIKVDGINYGIPQMVCANLFFYRQGDEEAATAGNIDRLYEFMGDYEGTEIKLQDGKGLLVDMSSGTGNICLYMDALVDSESVYTDFTQMPDLNNISISAIQALNNMILMGGTNQVYKETEGSYDRAEWFASGSGRTYIGYSESMSQMGDYVSEVQVDTISLADREDIPLFYVDIAAVNADIAQDKKYAALKLLNLMASKEVMTKSVAGDEESGPLYVMPARSSCYEDLKEDIPVYAKLQEITGKSSNHVFRMGNGSHEYIEEAKKILPQYLIQKEKK